MRLKKMSLAIQFRRSFILIVVASFICSMITVVATSTLFVSSEYLDFYPSNYSEQQIPVIETYIQEESSQILNPESEPALEKMMRGSMLYLVVQADGSPIYGTLSSPPYHSEEEFHSILNTTVMNDGRYIKTIPIVDESGSMKGGVLLSYSIKITFLNMAGRIKFFFFIVGILSPFIYIILFVAVFSRRFAKKINEPLNILKSAARKIKQKDLDFEIDYHANNELGQLCTAFSEMKEELQNSLSVQWRMEQERVEMVAALAHDLKSPLSIILAYTDALLEDNQEGNKELLQYLSIIRENAERSALLVKQMQYTTGLENSNAALSLVEINLKDFLLREMQVHEMQAEKEQIHIRLQMQGEIPELMKIDTDKLRRILDNILSNSLQYTPAGGQINVEVMPDKERILYKICDTGCGFSEKDLRKALERFYRGDEARQTKDGHSGLGLYIAKQLTEQLGGSIQIGNGENGGACVVFWHKVFI